MKNEDKKIVETVKAIDKQLKQKREIRYAILAMLSGLTIAVVAASPEFKGKDEQPAEDIQYETSTVYSDPNQIVRINDDGTKSIEYYAPNGKLVYDENGKPLVEKTITTIKEDNNDFDAIPHYCYEKYDRDLGGKWTAAGKITTTDVKLNDDNTRYDFIGSYIKMEEKPSLKKSRDYYGVYFEKFTKSDKNGEWVSDGLVPSKTTLLSTGPNERYDFKGWVLNSNTFVNSPIDLNTIDVDGETKYLLPEVVIIKYDPHQVVTKNEDGTKTIDYLVDQGDVLVYDEDGKPIAEKRINMRLN